MNSETETDVPFFQSHIAGVAPLDVLGNISASKVNSKEWEAFRSTFPPFGTSIDDDIAAKMAIGLESFVNSIMDRRFSKFRYAVSHGLPHNGAPIVPSPDAVMDIYTRPSVQPIEDSDEATELLWDRVVVLFDFSSHMQDIPSSKPSPSLSSEEFGNIEGKAIESVPLQIPSDESIGTQGLATSTNTHEVHGKKLAWARAIRAKVSRAFVTGFSFDGNQYYQWLVKEDESVVTSSVLGLPGVTGAPLENNVLAQAKAVNHFLIAFDTLALSENVFVAKGNYELPSDPH